MPNDRWNDDAVIRRLTRKVVDRLELVGEFVENAAKVNCPVDTGNLRGSITHKVDKQDLSVTIGTNVDYAPYQEFGTYKMKAHPFLRPALIENKANIIRILTT